jgi:hypothetical protein
MLRTFPYMLKRTFMVSPFVSEALFFGTTRRVRSPAKGRLAIASGVRVWYIREPRSEYDFSAECQVRVGVCRNLSTTFLRVVGYFGLNSTRMGRAETNQMAET